MKKLQLILLTIVSLSACTKAAVSNAAKANDTTVTTKPMTTTGSLSYLALGDSYTIGESVPQAQSYPYQLINQLNTQGLNVQSPTIIATTGWTTDNLIDAILQSGLIEKKYDFVTLLIGVNDQYQHLSTDNYTIKFNNVLNTAIAFAGGDKTKVFVISIPDWGVTPYANGQDAVIGPEIDKFNAINKAESLKAGVNYLDITPISRQAASNTALVAEDGLHPSGQMYKMWVDLLEPLVLQRFKK